MGSNYFDKCPICKSKECRFTEWETIDEHQCLRCGYFYYDDIDCDDEPIEHSEPYGVIVYHFKGERLRYVTTLLQEADSAEHIDYMAIQPDSRILNYAYISRYVNGQFQIINLHMPLSGRLFLLSSRLKKLTQPTFALLLSLIKFKKKRGSFLETECIDEHGMTIFEFTEE